MAGRILVTGASGVLGRAAVPELRRRGEKVLTPGVGDLDLFDPRAVSRALADVEVVVHLATKLPPPDQRSEPGAWDLNDRLRDVAVANLVAGGLANQVRTLVVPTVAFVTDPPQPFLRSALAAEQHVADFAATGGRGVVLRLGLLYGPGTGSDEPVDRVPVHLHVDDAGHALALAPEMPSGTYEVTEEKPDERFATASGWRPRTPA